MDVSIQIRGRRAWTYWEQFAKDVGAARIKSNSSIRKAGPVSIYNWGAQGRGPRAATVSPWRDRLPVEPRWALAQGVRNESPK